MRAEFADLPRFSDHVLVDGAFDPLHAGHVAYLKAARDLQRGPLLCAVASDDQIREKGREPLLPQESRVAVLEALCDVVYAKDRPTEEVIRQMRPVAYVKGLDWKDGIPPEQMQACEDVGASVNWRSGDAVDSSTDRLRAWALKDADASLGRLEAFIAGQASAAEPWRPVTDYSFEARKAIEGRHPDLIVDVFQPKRVLDAGCGPGYLVRLLRERGVEAYGFDLNPPNHPNAQWFDYDDLCCDLPLNEWNTSPLDYDLVVNRECLEHLTVPEIRKAVTNLCKLSSRFVYGTTRFHPTPSSLFDFTTEFDADPTHISCGTHGFIRMLFALEGFRYRADLAERMDWLKKGRTFVFERAS